MRGRNPTLYKTLHPRDTPLADERERRRLEMLQIDVGRKQMKRNAARGDKQELLKVEALAAEARSLITRAK
jgi:hypothetical protein